MAKKKKRRLTLPIHNELVSILMLFFTVIGGIAGLMYLIALFTPPSVHYEDNIHVAAHTSFIMESIYVKDNDKLHITWSVINGVEVTSGFVTPMGDFFGFEKDSNSVKKDLRILLEKGSIAFRPREYNWGEGYYDIQFTAYSQSAMINVSYRVD